MKNKLFAEDFELPKTSHNAHVSTSDTPDIERLREKLRSGQVAGHYYVLLLGLRTFDTAGLLARIGQGLSYNALERFGRNAGLSRDEVCDLIQIPPRTLARRKEEGRLHPDESDRLLRASRILALVIDLFEGDAGASQRWFSTPQPALGGALPLQFSRTEVGAREVEALIGRLEHGIPA